MAVILGIDYGQKRIGLALTDETETIAQSINPITVKNSEDALKQLDAFLKDNNIASILIGLPLGIDEKPTQMSNEVLNFADKLKKLTGIEYDTWNETLTSEIAKTNPIGLGKGEIDSESARIILQEFLDFRKENV